MARAGSKVDHVRVWWFWLSLWWRGAQSRTPAPESFKKVWQTLTFRRLRSFLPRFGGRRRWFLRERGRGGKRRRGRWWRLFRREAEERFRGRPFVRILPAHWRCRLDDSSLGENRKRRQVCRSAQIPRVSNEEPLEILFRHCFHCPGVWQSPVNKAMDPVQLPQDVWAHLQSYMQWRRRAAFNLRWGVCCIGEDSIRGRTPGQTDMGRRTDSKPAACRGGKLPRQAALSPFPGCRCAARAIPGDDEPPRRPYGSGFPFPRRSGAMGAVRATRPRYALLRFRPFTSLHCCDPAISSAHIIFTHDSSDVFRVPGCQCRSPSL